MRMRWWKLGWRAVLFLVPFLMQSPVYSQTSSCEAEYKQAAKTYYQYKQNSDLIESRCRELVDSFRNIAETYPHCHKADDALYMVGVLSIRAYRSGGDARHLDSAMEAFGKLAEEYRDSSLADDAQYFCGEVSLLQGDLQGAEDSFRKVLDFRSGDMDQKAQNRLQEIEFKKSAEELVSASPSRQDKKNPEDSDKPQQEIPPAPDKENTEEEKPDEAATGPNDEGTDHEGFPPLPDEYQEEGASGAQSATTDSESLESVLENETSKNKDLARLQEIRHWSNKDYTRVVIDLDREVPYRPPHLLKPDPQLGTPPRLYIDFEGVVISKTFRQRESTEEGCFGYALPIGDGLLKKARAGQYQKDVVRVVLDIERIDHYKAFALPGTPFRYVIDVYGDAAKKSSPGVARKKEHETGKEKRRSPDRKFLVVLDPGHGGTRRHL